MPILYEPASQAINDQIDRIMKAHHEELHEAQVDVRGLMAFAKDGEPAVKLHGYECYAIVKKVGVKERAQGLPDALIIIDAHKWEKLSQRQRDALLDHELTHLELVAEDEKKGGGFKTDVLGRPQLTMRLHDWQLGGFASVVDRWGDDALDREQVRVCVEEWGQTFWDFGPPPHARRIEEDEISRPRRQAFAPHIKARREPRTRWRGGHRRHRTIRPHSQAEGLVR